MKNVAGYDVARLLAGSLGTLGLIVDVSLKVLPKPAMEATLAFEMNEATALQTLNGLAGTPLPISASNWRGGTLSVRLSGAGAAEDSSRAQTRIRSGRHLQPATLVFGFLNELPTAKPRRHSRRSGNDTLC